MNTIHVCTAFDEAFRIPASIMMHSVVKNTEHKIHFHLMVPDLAENELEKFLSDMRWPTKSEISIYTVSDNTLIPELRMRGVKHFSDAAIYRLFMADYLPKSIDRILYLDGDLFVNVDIFDIFKNYSNSIFSARIENKEDGYFNSGVFLTSLNYWRTHTVREQAIAFLQQNPNLEYKDQDSLNYIFKSSNFPLKKIYNFPFTDFEIYPKGVVSNYIFHFTGSIKPWKNHAPEVFPINLWRKAYSELYLEEVPLQKVKWSLLKKSIIWIKFLTKIRFPNPHGNRYYEESQN